MQLFRDRLPLASEPVNLSANDLPVGMGRGEDHCAFQKLTRLQVVNACIELAHQCKPEVILCQLHPLREPMETDFQIINDG